jgi:hypothetical protein
MKRRWRGLSGWWRVPGAAGLPHDYMVRDRNGMPQATHQYEKCGLGVIKRIKGTYRYYLTKAGRAATAAAGRLVTAVIVPDAV